MKLIKHITDLNKAVKNEKKLGFVPTMGNLHKGHESLIKISKVKCEKTMVSVFVNPTQFSNKKDYKTYPRNLKNDLKVLKKLKVDFVFLPSATQIYKDVKKTKISLNKSEKILCAKFRNGHFEGVLKCIKSVCKINIPKNNFYGGKRLSTVFSC